MRRDLRDAERFAKCATVVTKLYSLHLDGGTPLIAKTSWVRFIPTDMAGPAYFSGEPAIASLGMGEVHEVPYERTVLQLPDHDRRLAILDWLQANLLDLAASLRWDTRSLDDAYQACRRDGCRFLQRGKPKASPDRRYRAHVEFEIDGEGDGWSWVVITNRSGATIAVCDRRDSYASITASRRVRRSLRWQGAEVTWTPWTDDMAPKGFEWWLGHVQRFPAPAV
jgi:hypothetical protein